MPGRFAVAKVVMVTVLLWSTAFAGQDQPVNSTPLLGSRGVNVGVAKSEVPQGIKSLCGNSAAPTGLESYTHSTQRSAFGSTLGYTESPLRGWFLTVCTTVATQTLVLTQTLKPSSYWEQSGTAEAMPFQELIAETTSRQDQSSSSTLQFHGTYEELKLAQKQLIDEWYADYNRMTGDHSDPHEYNQFSLSTRTTYEAVTHALMTTNLTDKSGKPMGTALELVGAIEAINGKVARARGDLQFRMYVLLKPDALQKLKDSTEFFRDRDNTVYHHGFPLNYRQDGTPSIQFSMAKDGRHADIDVDYRSSGFPQGLFNGHLTAANSDVRAGNNTQVHLQRWQGLTDWWHNLFGLPGVVDDPNSDLLPGDVPPIPAKADGKLEDAVQDFLQSWLVQQKPELSASFLSPRSFACLAEYGPQAGNPINAGIAPYVAAKDLGAISRAIGKVASVQDAVQPSSLDERDIKPVKQAYAAEFSLYQLPDGVAADFECDPEKAFDEFDQARISGRAKKYGSYFASVFRLKAPKGKSDAITLVWAKDGKYWKVVSWEVEPEEAQPGAMPDTRRRKAVATAPRPEKAKLKADPEVVQASHDFLHTWLVDDNYDGAAGYVSPRSDACVAQYLAEGQKPPATPEEYAAAIRRSLTTVGKDVGKVEHLREALEPVRPEHEDLQVVAHAGEHAYTLVAVPDSLAGSFLCDKRSLKNPYAPDDAAALKVYGNYYATLFTFRTPGDHPAALTLLWGKDGGRWKIVAYEVVTP
jgi:hypothetical protein